MISKFCEMTLEHFPVQVTTLLDNCTRTEITFGFVIRLENEHLNNVGKYRAFKSVPLPFVYHEEDDEDKEE